MRGAVGRARGRGQKNLARRYTAINNDKGGGQLRPFYFYYINTLKKHLNYMRVLRLLISTLLLNACIAANVSIAQESHAAVLGRTSHGAYFEYTPKGTARNVLVIVHGTPEPGDNVSELARKFIERWEVFADRHSLILIAPIFDDNFGSRDSSVPGVAPGGYRGLFGKVIGADEFVHEIVAKEGGAINNFDGKFYLYGHSAGAQFVARYCVRHAQRVHAAVISAAGRFPYPDPTAPWPYGMGQSEHISVAPKKDGWLQASLLPITVLVGTSDIEPQPVRPGHKGSNRKEFAESWVSSMNQLAKSNGRNANVNLKYVDNVGHSSKGLTLAAQQALEEHVD